MGVNTDYLISISSLIKIAEIVFSFIVFGLASASGSYYLHLNVGIGWVLFTGLVGFIVALVFFTMRLLYTCQIHLKGLIETILNVVLALMFLTAALLAAVRAGEARKSYHLGETTDIVIVTSLFCFLAMISFILDVLWLYFVWDCCLWETIPRTSAGTTTTVTSASYPGQNIVY